MTSDDGITWTSRTSAADNAWRGIAWSPELYTFVSVCDNSGATINDLVMVNEAGSSNPFNI